MLLYLLLALVLNFYAFRGVAILFNIQKSQQRRMKLIYSYFLIDILFIVFSIFWIIVIRTSDWHDFVKYRNYAYVSGAFALIYFTKFSFVPFVLINDLKKIAVFIFKTYMLSGHALYRKSKKAYNKNFVLKAGILVSAVMFLFVLHGIVIGKTNYQVEEVSISYDKLPESFDGFVIAHISDTHLGSFEREENVIKGIKKIIGQSPDLVLFTGDLVNNEALEGMPYIDVFNELEPPYGKYSVLGNHDIGDYRRWYTIEKKDPDIRSIEKLHAKFGFELLRDQHDFIHKGGDSIMIAGVDNWGLPPFEKTGDLTEAISPYYDFQFIILLSHDPTHWGEKVRGKENIRLTLSGHTHGLQLGINIFGFRWSPAKYKYQQWQGLYEQNGQYLYVNTGFGFLLLPLRIGMPPEITIITLNKESI